MENRIAELEFIVQAQWKRIKRLSILLNIVLIMLSCILLNNIYTTYRHTKTENSLIKANYEGLELINKIINLYSENFIYTQKMDK